MPENIPTQTANEKLIRDYAEANGHEISKGKAQRLALKWHKRQQLIGISELHHLFGHSDPTAETAVRNVLQQKNGPGTVAKQYSEAA
ncbi:hypothetical protein [Paeniglutamicibacter psychrophenolicus]|uniref:hypothetical protein n=1 Tax=Paeniglutamicibacter psychrophenolicus TaxID=257454 RepID=UPI0027887679|nr:hypothetical protein [Paeniglutamicibacter psychrophenolicus]MDQ0094415.1 hypothetical protein [Paeniglutamicibacter psychrophenolicus]